DDAEFGFTAGWLHGQTVQFFYHKPFFCRTPVEDGNPVGATTACEVGSDGTVDPRLGNIPILYVMTPIGFRPAESTLQCPMVGHCNHPSTIDLSRVFGPGTENAPLPAHSHIVDQAEGNWWELHVIGVKDPATWDQVVGGAVCLVAGIRGWLRPASWVRWAVALLGGASAGFGAWLIVQLLITYRRLGANPLLVPRLGPGLFIAVAGALVAGAAAARGLRRGPSTPTPR